MAPVLELSASYANFMLGPRPGPDVCAHCFDLTGGGTRCHHCSHDGGWVDAMAPISYSIGGEQLHHALGGYKRYADPAGRVLTAGLGAVLWRHLSGHEACLARAAGVDRFDVITTVASSAAVRDETHPLHRLVGEVVKPLAPNTWRCSRSADMSTGTGATTTGNCADCPGRLTGGGAFSAAGE